MLRVYCSWPGAIDDDEAARVGIEIFPRDIDGDALLALGDKTVEQHRIVGLIGAGSLTSGAADVLALILIKIGSIPQQAADQRRLAVVDGAARQEMDDAAEFAHEVRGYAGRGLGLWQCLHRHQK